MNNTITNETIPQPSFQWEVPVLYTEEWLQTLGGGITDIIENGFYHT
jgi:hypothetical protein